MKTINEKFPFYTELYIGNGATTPISLQAEYKAVPSILLRKILNDASFVVSANYEICPSLLALASDTSYVSDYTRNNLFWRGMDLYFHQHFGHKIINPEYEDLTFYFKMNLDYIPTDGAKFIGFNILTLYGSKWDVLIKSLGILQYRDNDFKYKPLENYDKTSSISVGEINHNGSVSKYERTTEDYGTESNTKDGSMTVNTTGTSANNGSTNTHSQKGFNSSSWNETDKDVATNQINQDVTTDFDNYSDTHTWGSAQTPNKTTTKSSANGDTVDVDETRNSTTTESTHGNIGVTTSQQMLESELVMRNNIIYQTICQDLAKYLSLSVY